MVILVLMVQQVLQDQQALLVQLDHKVSKVLLDLLVQLA
jgi:hypothetical protein